jgi:hypothetical protein
LTAIVVIAGSYTQEVVSVIQKRISRSIDIVTVSGSNWSAPIEWSGLNVSAWPAWLPSERWFPGLASLIIGLPFLAAVQLFFVGIVGEYIGPIHTRVLNTPMVIEKEKTNFD